MGLADAVDHPVHQWEHAGGRWRCARCWTFIVGDRGVPAARRREPCRELRVPMQQEEFVKAGHLMLQTEGDLPITFCARCGGWSSRRANRLNKPCGPPTAAGRMALRRIEKGLHPWQARDSKTGKCLPRGKLKIRRGPKLGRLSRDEGGEEGAGALRQVLGLQPSETEVADMPVPMADDEDIDVFGHGGSLDEAGAQCPTPPEGKDGPAAAPVAALQGGDGTGRTEHVRSECTTREALEGSSMAMLLAVLRDTPRHYPLGQEVAVFNATKGTVVTATLSAIQGEVQRLRGLGVRDEECADGAPRTEAHDRGGDGVDAGDRAYMVTSGPKCAAPAVEPGARKRGGARRSPCGR